MVTIYGKDDCPYTQAAIEDHEDRGIAFRYVNVQKTRADLDEMLKYTGGRRRVPVLVNGDKVTVGFGGT